MSNTPVPLAAGLEEFVETEALKLLLGLTIKHLDRLDPGTADVIRNTASQTIEMMNFDQPRAAEMKAHGRKVIRDIIG